MIFTSNLPPIDSNNYYKIIRVIFSFLQILFLAQLKISNICTFFRYCIKLFGFFKAQKADDNNPTLPYNG